MPPQTVNPIQSIVSAVKQTRIKQMGDNSGKEHVEGLSGIVSWGYILPTCRRIQST